MSLEIPSTPRAARPSPEPVSLLSSPPTTPAQVGHHCSPLGARAALTWFPPCPQAFRQLSHRFHGKGSGKMKTERRMKKLDEEAVGGPWGRRGGGFDICWGGCSLLVLTGCDPTAPEEDELQRHAPGHRGFTPGKAKGPEDAVHRAQRQWQEHERVSGLGEWAGRVGRAGGGPACLHSSLIPFFSLQEHHHQVKPSCLPMSPTLILNKVPSLFFPPWSWCRFQG